MDNTEEIIKQLSVGFSQPINSVKESFFFDKQNQIFFSIHAIDYFMFNEQLEIEDPDSSSYSLKTLKDIQYWVKKIDANDPIIQFIPQTGDKDNNILREKSIEFIKQNNINVKEAQVWYADTSEVSVKFSVNDNQKELKNKKWWEFWK